jgi:F0F1-type ATP synthase delta subunit
MAKLSRRVIARVVAQKLLAEPQRRSHWLQVAAAYMVENHLEHDVDLLVNDIAHELFMQSGQLSVAVTSARPLADAARAELKRTLQEATHARRVTFSETVDPALLGGVIARTPDAQLDLSVRTRLQQLATIK